MTLLFRLAEWHALAKLRMHTDSTLTRLETITTVLGCELRKFSQTTCSAFSTVELPKEAAARGRKQSRQKAKATERSTEAGKAFAATRIPTRRTKKLNLSIYKAHALGDYARTIRMHGTTDSYSTQMVGPHVHWTPAWLKYPFLIGRTRTSSDQATLRSH
jgi:hypothetical protein